MNRPGECSMPPSPGLRALFARKAEWIRPVKVVCGWCSKFLRGIAQADLISHGICSDCAAKYRASFPRRSQ